MAFLSRGRISAPRADTQRLDRLDPWAFLSGGLPKPWAERLPDVTLSALMASKSGTSLAGERVSGVQKQPRLLSAFN